MYAVLLTALLILSMSNAILQARAQGSEIEVTAGSSAQGTLSSCPQANGSNGTGLDVQATVSGDAAGWTSPQSLDFGYIAFGDCSSESFTVSVPDGTPAGDYSLVWTLTCQVVGANEQCNSGTEAYDVVVQSSTQASTTTVACDPDSVNAGESSTCTASVTGNSPTGTVTFTSDSSSGVLDPDTCSLEAGECGVSFSDSQAGTVTITADYSGDSSNDPSSGSTTITVTSPAPTASATSVDCAPNPVDAGSGATCTATVTGNSPTGSVDFSSDSSTGGFSAPSCDLAAGSCAVSFSDSRQGTVTITADYGGDSNNGPSSGSTELEVVSQVTQSSTSVDCAPNPVGVSSETSCDVTVTGSSPTGTVSFTSSSGTGSFSQDECPLQASGGCGVTFVDSAAGSVTITADYSGDTDNTPSSGQVQLLVVSTASSLAVECSPNPIGLGSQSTCTATVTGTSPTGTVTFSTLSGEGSFSPETCPLVDGSCTSTYTGSVAGTIQILAVYSGDSANGQASSSTNLVVTNGVTTSPSGPVPTTTQVSCAPNPVTASGVGYDEDITCTATVTGSSPTGLVAFTSDSQGIFNGFYSEGYCPLSSSGSCSVTYWSTTEATITASYQGDPTNSPSSGQVVVKIESRDPTTTALNCIPNPVEAGYSTVCYASVSGSFLPTGTVSFSTDSPGGIFANSGQCTLKSASFEVSACHLNYVDTASGTATIRAIYGGDVTDMPSGNTVVLVVTPSANRGTTTSVDCSPNPVDENAQTRCTVTVTGGNSPGSIVKFSSDTGVYGSFYPYAQCTLGSGSCQVAFSSLFSGRITISAYYQGDPNNDQSTGSTVIQVLDTATPSLVVHSSIHVAGSGAASEAEITSSSLSSPITLAGTIHLSQFSTFKISLDTSDHVLSLAFNITGSEGTEGYSSLTIPKDDAPSKDVPVVIMDGSYADNQSYTQDTTNFYLTFQTQFSNHTVDVEFVSPQVVNPPKPSPLPPVQWIYDAIGVFVVIGVPLLIAVLLLGRVRRRRRLQKPGSGALAPSPRVKSFCGSCGSPVQPDETFCTNCGADLTRREGS